IALFEMFEHFLTAIWNLDKVLFFDKVWTIWFPMLIGSIPLFIVSYFTVYGVSLKALKKYKGVK
ncbi:MAG: hypothetical protein ACTSXV_01110, partial [Alphaproteobacteria bacterium]